MKPALEGPPSAVRSVEGGKQLLLGTPGVGHGRTLERFLELFAQRRLGRAQPLDPSLDGLEGRLQGGNLVRRGLVPGG